LENIFYGASSKVGLRAGIFLVSPSDENHSLSFRLEFETTINVVECEALILGLEANKRIRVQNITIFVDFELIIHQISDKCHNKHPWMRAYTNQVKYLLNNFFF